jgi:uncharacterized protein
MNLHFMTRNSAPLPSTARVTFAPLTAIAGRLVALLFAGAMLTATHAQEKPAPTSEYDPTKIAPTVATEKGQKQEGQEKTEKAEKAEKAEKTEKPEPIKRANDQRRAFLWRVTDSKNTVYLFGTMHVGTKSFYPLPAVVENALDSAKKIVVESDISKTDGLDEIEKMMFFAPPQTLDKVIPKPLLDRLNAQLTKFSLPPDGVKPMKPWAVGGFLSVNEIIRLGYDMNASVDAYVIEAAKKRDKPLLELETQVAQIKVLNSMTPKQQETYLENALYSLEKGIYEKQINGLVEAWLAADPAKFETVYAEMAKPLKNAAELDDVMLHSRHDAMVKKIESYLASGEPHFVAVGALHLLGPKGLVALLKNRRLKVEQVGVDAPRSEPSKPEPAKAAPVKTEPPKSVPSKNIAK